MRKLVFKAFLGIFVILSLLFGFTTFIQIHPLSDVSSSPERKEGRMSSSSTIEVPHTSDIVIPDKVMSGSPSGLVVLSSTSPDLPSTSMEVIQSRAPSSSGTVVPLSPSSTLPPVDLVSSPTSQHAPATESPPSSSKGALSPSASTANGTIFTPGAIIPFEKRLCAFDCEFEWARKHFPVLEIEEVFWSFPNEAKYYDGTSKRPTTSSMETRCNDTLLLTVITKNYFKDGKNFLQSCEKQHIQCVALQVSGSAWIGPVVEAEDHLRRSFFTIRPFILLKALEQTDVNIAYVDADFEVLLFPSLFCDPEKGFERSDFMILDSDAQSADSQTQLGHPMGLPMFWERGKMEQMSSYGGVIWVRNKRSQWSHAASLAKPDEVHFVEEFLVDWNVLYNFGTNIMTADDVLLDHLWRWCWHTKLNFVSLPVQYQCAACLMWYAKNNMNVVKDQVLFHTPGVVESTNFGAQCVPIFPVLFEEVLQFGKQCDITKRFSRVYRSYLLKRHLCLYSDKPDFINLGTWDSKEYNMFLGLGDDGFFHAENQKRSMKLPPKK